MTELREAICRLLPAQDQPAALSFLRFLQDSDLHIRRDTSTYWRDKAYFHVLHGEDCVCFIAIGNPQEPANRWTVWSADIGDAWLAGNCRDERLREMAWAHVDRCGHCGSCGGGRSRVIFGRSFDAVCGCTFRLDNPGADELPLLRQMAALRLRELQAQNTSTK